jgi:manganese oxidase
MKTTKWIMVASGETFQYVSHHSIHLHGYYFKVVVTDGGEIPETGQWPETTVHMPPGSTRTVELVANAPGDWVIHCHMLHHAKKQMGHTFGSLIGINTAGFDQKIRKLIPNYMTMGQDGTGDMGNMGMPAPPNPLPMVCAQGQHDYITMGGRFTMLKVREELPADGSDPGWYRSPPGILAEAAPEEDLKRDGIELHKDLPKSAARLSRQDQAWCGTPPKTPPLVAQSQPKARVKLQ